MCWQQTGKRNRLFSKGLVQRDARRSSGVNDRRGTAKTSDCRPRYKQPFTLLRRPQRLDFFYYPYALCSAMHEEVVSQFANGPRLRNVVA